MVNSIYPVYEAERRRKKAQGWEVVEYPDAATFNVIDYGLSEREAKAKAQKLNEATRAAKGGAS